MKLRGIIFNEVEPANLFARNVKEWFIDEQIYPRTYVVRTHQSQMDDCRGDKKRVSSSTNAYPTIFVFFYHISYAFYSHLFGFVSHISRCSLKSYKRTPNIGNTSRMQKLHGTKKLNGKNLR